MAKALTEVGPDVMARMATEASARRLYSLGAAMVGRGGSSGEKIETRGRLGYKRDVRLAQ